ncbi:hypothetical protein CVT25_003346 [Psilocybe cyanescens]|uniref:Uncharacterized protein n=1 Tax=Psilocybe cyanescens TaxID=93625 RepID=A0A409X028_PSICY|nr:hypothetical protein CVT25_003346 [Psilocybe cyanescens]
MVPKTAHLPIREHNDNTMSLTILSSPPLGSDAPFSTPTPSVSPNPTNPDGMDDGGLQQRGANYFFGFLITFVVLLLVFVACGIGSRRRLLAGRQRAGGVFGLDGVGGGGGRGTVPWTALGSDGYGGVRYKLPELYEKSFVPGYSGNNIYVDGKESEKVPYYSEDIGAWRYMAPLSVALCRQRPTAVKESPEGDASVHDSQARHRGSGVQPDVEAQVPVPLPESELGTTRTDSPIQGHVQASQDYNPNVNTNTISQTRLPPPSQQQPHQPPPQQQQQQQPEETTSSSRRDPHPRGHALSLSSWLRPHPTLAFPSHQNPSHNHPPHNPQLHRQTRRSNNNNRKDDEKLGPPEALQIAVMIVMPQAPQAGSSSSSSSSSSFSRNGAAVAPTRGSVFTIGDDKDESSRFDEDEGVKKRMSESGAGSLSPPSLPPSLPGYEVEHKGAGYPDSGIGIGIGGAGLEQQHQSQRQQPLRMPEYQIGVATVPWQAELFVT